MYTITELVNGKWLCEGRLQDSTERWEEATWLKAVESMVLFARTGNGAYITKADITFRKQTATVSAGKCTDAEFALLDKLKRGELVALPFNCKLLNARLTERECEIVQQLREGKLHLVDPNTGNRVLVHE